MIFETPWRSISKALAWRFFSTLLTVVFVFCLTRQVKLAASLGLFEVTSKTLIYFFHERLWNNIRFGRRALSPVVVWFTGLSGSGKTTVARRVHEELKRKGVKVEYLDGDGVRHIFPQTGFTKADRDMHIRRVGHLAGALEKNGVFVVASFISPYAESRKFVRGLCKNFVEVYVSTPLQVCERRDAKGLYQRARRGEIKNFTGVDDPYERPTEPEINVNMAELSCEEACSQVIGHLERRFLN